MTIVFAVANLLALVLIVGMLFLRQSKQGPSLNRDRISLFTWLFCGWLVAAVFLNTYFFSIRLGFFDLSLERLFFVLLAVVALFQLFRKRINFQGSHRVDLLILLFLLVCLASLFAFGFLPEHPRYPSPWNTFFVGYLVPAVAFFYAKYFLRGFEDMRAVMSAFFLIGVYICWTAFLEFFDLNALVFPRYIVNTELTLHLDRARGPFLNAAFNGLAMSIGFIAGIFLLEHVHRIAKIFVTASLLLFPPALFFTQTRSVYLLFLVVMAVLLFFYRTRFPKWKLLPLIIAGLFFFVLANTDRFLSQERKAGGVYQIKEVEIRFQLVQRSLNLAGEHLFSGVGLARFASTDSTPEMFQEVQHNHIIALAVELGLFGLAAYLALLLSVFVRLHALADNPAATSGVRGNLLILLGLGVCMNLLNNTFLEPSFCLFANVSLFIFIGLIENLHNRARQDELMQFYPLS